MILSEHCTPHRDYEEAKKILKAARSELQMLSLRTTARVQNIKSFLTSKEWDDSDPLSTLDVELRLLKVLLKESVKGLREAKKKYKRSMDLIQSNDKRLDIIHTSQDAKLKVIRRKSQQLDQEIVRLNKGLAGLKKNIDGTADSARTINYSTLGGIAATCGIIDIFALGNLL